MKTAREQFLENKLALQEVDLQAAKTARDAMRQEIAGLRPQVVEKEAAAAAQSARIEALKQQIQGFTPQLQAAQGLFEEVAALRRELSQAQIVSMNWEAASQKNYKAYLGQQTATEKAQQETQQLRRQLQQITPQLEQAQALAQANQSHKNKKTLTLGAVLAVVLLAGIFLIKDPYHSYALNKQIADLQKQLNSQQTTLGDTQNYVAQQEATIREMFKPPEKLSPSAATAWARHKKEFINHFQVEQRRQLAILQTNQQREAAASLARQETALESNYLRTTMSIWWFFLFFLLLPLAFLTGMVARHFGWLGFILVWIMLEER